MSVWLHCHALWIERHRFDDDLCRPHHHEIFESTLDEALPKLEPSAMPELTGRYPKTWLNHLRNKIPKRFDFPAYRSVNLAESPETRKKWLKCSSQGDFQKSHDCHFRFVAFTPKARSSAYFYPWNKILKYPQLIAPCTLLHRWPYDWQSCACRIFQNFVDTRLKPVFSTLNNSCYLEWNMQVWAQLTS